MSAQGKQVPDALAPELQHFLRVVHIFRGIERAAWLTWSGTRASMSQLAMFLCWVRDPCSF